MRLLWWTTPKIQFTGRPTMHALTRCLGRSFIASLALLMHPTDSLAQTKAPMASDLQPNARRDGQHDFDFEIGTWNTHLKRLVRPLTGSTTWVEYDGTTTVRKVWNGRANLVELEGER